MSIWFIIFTIAMTGMLVVGDYLIKYATVGHNKVLLLVIAAVLWTLSIPGWYCIVRDHRESIVGALFAVFSIIGTTIIGIYGFDEKLTTTEWAGIGLAVISALLLTNKI